jgi:aspartyl-tRNA(Asn)/glutamyl-tRNA(Gln) amidotransferase subunit A
VSQGRLAPPRLTALAADFRQGRRSPLEFLERMLERIEANAASRAYITVTQESALEQARKANASVRREGVLFGVPYACKDLFFTRGIATTAGSRALQDWIPDYDAAVIERLSDAGAILVGKTNMHEFAHGATGENAVFGTPVNPYDSARFAGGSSSGSAVAVALGLACFALGSDTGGSTRIPAALCGLVGLKPTYGRVSLFGAIPYCWSVDHAGILSNSAEDAAAVLQAIAGFDSRDPASADLPVEDFGAVQGGAAAQRIGILRADSMPPLEPAIDDAYRKSIEGFAAAGAEIADVALPDLGEARTVALLVQMPEALAYHRRHLVERGSLYGDDVRAGFALGQFILAEHYVTAKRMIERYRRHMNLLFKKVDAILTPTCPIVAPKLGCTTVMLGGEELPVGNVLTCFTSLFNITGNPAVTVPCGRSAEGLPIGLQIIGRPFEDGAILRLAHEHEKRWEGLSSD